MSQLGSYITWEYAILVKIFSFLPSKSLASASQVCREWQEVARRVISRRNKPISYCRTSREYRWGRFDDGPQPKIILHLASKYFHRKNDGIDFYSMVSHIYNLDYVPVYNIKNSYFIASECVNNTWETYSRLGRNAECALILCDMPGVNIKSFLAKPGISKREVENIVKRIVALPDTKCIILIPGGGNGCVNVADIFMTSFNKYETLIVAGGVAEKPVINERINKNPPPYSCLCISFHGTNVEASVGVHDLKDDIDEFLENLANTVGPLPNGAVRLAFMFTCVNRFDMYGLLEADLFSKHFPDIPVYGFWSYGEIGVFDKKVPEVTADYPWLKTECTSYLIITFKRDVL